MEEIGASQKSKLRLLFVEDNPADAELALKQLQIGGFDVTADIVQTADEFRNKLASGNYDIILSDLGLPNWSGLEALEILKQTSLDIPFIMVTGTVGEETVAECLKLGATDYVLKDRPARLPAAVERALEEKRLREERNQAENALIKERHLLLTLLDNLPDLIYFKDRESHFSRINKALAKVYGLGDPAQAVGKTDFDFFTAEQALEYYRDEEGIIRTGLPMVDKEEKQAWPDGHVTWLSTTKMPLRDANGSITGTFGVSRDITERKKAEESLRESEERFRGIFENSGIGIALVDMQGHPIMSNPTLQQMFGYSEGELGHMVFTDYTHPDDRELDWGLFNELTAGKREKYEIEKRFLKKGGGVVWGLLTASLIKGRDGRPVCAVGMVRDITARKLLEDQFRQAQKMEAVGRLAAGVAHDFNNLLTVIVGYSDVMLDRFAIGDPLRAYTTEIKGAGERAAGLTRQLLAFSRQQVLVTKVIDMNTLIANLTKMLKRLIGEDIDLVFDSGSNPAMVKADPGLIEQVLMNLAVNARDAMPRGGKLTIETSHVQIDEAYSAAHFSMRVGPYVMLAVSDNGCGMDKDIQAHMFEPFFTTKEQGKGTGLGLATVYGIVKQSGGHIWVYSEPGAGTTFKIYLPAVKGALQAAPESAIPVGGSETVLLVEDDASLRELARMVLEVRGGYEVLVSSGGKEASLFAEQFKGTIHLLLTDVVMPGMSGRELSEKLTTSRPEMKILYMSGYTDDTVLRHGVLEEGMAFLQKPFTAESLLRKVRDVLDTPPPA